MKSDLPTQQCSAKSKQSGERCKQRVQFGFNVCKFHGGASPQAIASAKARLKEMQPKAILCLEDILNIDPNPCPSCGVMTNASLRTKVAFGILDRTGMGPNLKIELDKVGDSLSGLSGEDLAYRIKTLAEQFGFIVTEPEGGLTYPEEPEAVTVKPLLTQKNIDMVSFLDGGNGGLGISVPSVPSIKKDDSEW